MPLRRPTGLTPDVEAKIAALAAKKQEWIDAHPEEWKKVVGEIIADLERYEEEERADSGREDWSLMDKPFTV